MGGLVDHILNVDQGWLYLIVGALVFAEYALFVGFVLPGETATVLAGVQASRGHAHLSVVLLLVVLTGIIGAWVGFEVGRKFGSRLLNVRFLNRHQARLGQATDFLARRGGVALVLGRFVAFFRPVMPALAGIARMHYPKFLAFNALAGLIWGVTFVMVGYVSGDSYQRVEQAVGRSAAVAVPVLVVVVVAALHLRKRRDERAIELEASRPESA
jgi:membrane-associated protein